MVASPRQILRRQLDRLAERGWTATAGTELEFILFNDTYEEAWRKGYRDLEPANLYNVDYSMLGTARVEPLIRRIRNSMRAPGMRVENSKGECNFGQHEINFHYDDALATADDHVDLQERAPRRSPRRRATRSRSSRSSTSARATRATSTARSQKADGSGSVFAERRGHVQPLRGRPARLPARADAVLRPARQLVQALRARARSRRPRWRGATTTAPARCASSGTAQGAAGGEPAARAPT